MQRVYSALFFAEILIVQRPAIYAVLCVSPMVGKDKDCCRKFWKLEFKLNLIAGFYGTFGLKIFVL